jgi:hypothetical protein
MTKILNGGCLCGEVRFTVKDEFRLFHLCHCIQCRKITSSAFAANLFTETANLNWTAGEHLTRRFEYPGREFTKVFCTLCGSGLPFPSTDNVSIIVPAGALDEEPTIDPLRNIFWEEHTKWLDAGMNAPCVTGFDE